MVGLNITDHLPHGLYQDRPACAGIDAAHSAVIWETGEVIHNPF